MAGFFEQPAAKGATQNDLVEVVQLPIKREQELVNKAAAFKPGNPDIKLAIDVLYYVERVANSIISPAKDIKPSPSDDS